MDPVTVMATATACYNLIKKGIQTGKELEGMAKTLGQWFDCVSQFREHERSVSNPPIFKKLLFSGSAEQEALELLVHRKQIETQERELRELIMYRYGVESYREMLMMRREIKAQRAAAIANQKNQRKHLLTQTLLWTLTVSLCGLAGLLFWWMWKLIER